MLRIYGSFYFVSNQILAYERRGTVNAVIFQDARTATNLRPGGALSVFEPRHHGRFMSATR